MGRELREGLMLRTRKTDALSNGRLVLFKMLGRCPHSFTTVHRDAPLYRSDGQDRGNGAQGLRNRADFRPGFSDRPRALVPTSSKLPQNLPEVYALAVFRGVQKVYFGVHEGHPSINERP